MTTDAVTQEWRVSVEYAVEGHESTIHYSRSYDRSEDAIEDFDALAEGKSPFEVFSSYLTERTLWANGKNLELLTLVLRKHSAYSRVVRLIDSRIEGERRHEETT